MGGDHPLKRFQFLPRMCMNTINPMRSTAPIENPMPIGTVSLETSVHFRYTAPAKSSSDVSNALVCSLS